MAVSGKYLLLINPYCIQIAETSHWSSLVFHFHGCWYRFPTASSALLLVSPAEKGFCLLSVVIPSGKREE